MKQKKKKLIKTFWHTKVGASEILITDFLKINKKKIKNYKNTKI